MAAGLPEVRLEREVPGAPAQELELSKSDSSLVLLREKSFKLGLDGLICKSHDSLPAPRPAPSAKAEQETG